MASFAHGGVAGIVDVIEGKEECVGAEPAVSVDDSRERPLRGAVGGFVRDLCTNERLDSINDDAASIGTHLDR